MSDGHLYKAKRTDNGEWLKGNLVSTISGARFILPSDSEVYIPKGKNTIYSTEFYRVGPSTICWCTGRKDKNGTLIWENDITKLVLSDGEVRYFKVSFKKVIRKVLCHPDFDDDVAKVELNAICFEWNGYELFPCIDENGVSDVSKMEVVGNIFDNPGLLEAQNE